MALVLSRVFLAGRDLHPMRTMQGDMGLDYSEGTRAMLARMERADGASFVAAIGACARSRGAAPPACERALALLAEV